MATFKQAQTVISPSFLFVFNKEVKQGGNIGDLIKDCFFAGDYDPSISFIEEVKDYCEALNEAGFEGEYGVFNWK